MPPTSPHILEMIGALWHGHYLHHRLYVDATLASGLYIDIVSSLICEDITNVSMWAQTQLFSKETNNTDDCGLGPTEVYSEH